MGILTLAMAKAYVDDTANALGAVKGAPATIESITQVEGGTEVVFAWTGTDGTKQTQTMFVSSGSNVDLDTTLTQSGKAADAKATGDAIKNMSVVQGGLTGAQITALDNMFKVGAYTASAESAYAAFCTAFGITGGGDIGATAYFDDYSEWPVWGSGISVVDNGFSINSPALSGSAGIAVGVLQDGKYGDYKDKTLKISCDVAGEFSSDGNGIPIYLRTYTDVPEASYSDKATAFTRGPIIMQAKHVEWTITPSTATWEGGTPNDTDYLGLQFYGHFSGEATITNFSIEVV